MTRYVGFRLSCPVYQRLALYAKVQGITPSRWLQQAVEFKLEADIDGLSRLGDVWVVPADKVGILYQIEGEADAGDNA